MVYKFNWLVSEPTTRGAMKQNQVFCKKAPNHYVIHNFSKKPLINSLKSTIVRTFRNEIDNLITEALSKLSISSDFIGKAAANSVNISPSRERRHRAASRDFSLRFSLFLKIKKKTDYEYCGLVIN